MKKSLISILLAAIMLFTLLSGCSQSQISADFTALNQSYNITVYGSNNDQALQDVIDVYSAIESMLDTENPYSILYKVNHANGSGTVINGTVAGLISDALEINATTNGYFDITVYPLMELWGFTSQKYSIPNEIQINDALKKVSSDNIQLDSFSESGSFLLSLPAGAGITLNAAAQGCASAQATELLKSAGITSAIISCANFTRTIGAKPEDGVWNVGIRDPENESNFLGFITVEETAISTSSITSNSFMGGDGNSYCDIINPKTGYPTTSNIESATVICSDDVTADCLSTAILCLSSDEAIDLWRSSMNFELILYTTDHRIICTSGLTENFTSNANTVEVTFVE